MGGREGTGASGRSGTGKAIAVHALLQRPARDAERLGGPAVVPAVVRQRLHRPRAFRVLGLFGLVDGGGHLAAPERTVAVEVLWMERVAVAQEHRPLHGV